MLTTSFRRSSPRTSRRRESTSTIRATARGGRPPPTSARGTPTTRSGTNSSKGVLHLLPNRYSSLVGGSQQDTASMSASKTFPGFSNIYVFNERSFNTFRGKISLEGDDDWKVLRAEKAPPSLVEVRYAMG